MILLHRFTMMVLDCYLVKEFLMHKFIFFPKYRQIQKFLFLAADQDGY